MTLKLGIIMDPIEHIKTAKDSSFAMMLAAQKRQAEIAEALGNPRHPEAVGLAAFAATLVLGSVALLLLVMAGGSSTEVEITLVMLSLTVSRASLTSMVKLVVSVSPEGTRLSVGSNTMPRMALCAEAGSVLANV